MVTFTEQLNRDRRTTAELKTGRSRRTIEISAGLAARLRALRLASAHSGDRDFVFATATGRAQSQRHVGDVLRRAVKRAGIAGPAPTLHSLRHSHASAMIAAGWDIEEVSRRLGHANVGVTASTYIHAYESAARSKARAERLEAMRSGVGAPAGEVVAMETRVETSESG